jgi:hypothetical protein
MSRGQKVLDLLLQYEQQNHVYIYPVNRLAALQYVTQNYGINIPTDHEILLLIDRYIGIPVMNRNSSFLRSQSPFVKSLAKIPKKPLTPEEKKLKAEKKKEEAEFFQGLKEARLFREGGLPAQYAIAVQERDARIKRDEEECKLIEGYHSFGWASPAQRPPYFVTPKPDIWGGEQMCAACMEVFNENDQIAFCRYCSTALHLRCYNFRTPEQRILFFERDTGVCKFCHNGLNMIKLVEMGRKGISDDPTYFRWPRDAVLLPMSADDLDHVMEAEMAAENAAEMAAENARVEQAKAARARAVENARIRLEQDLAYNESLRIDAERERRRQEAICLANPQDCIQGPFCSAGAGAAPHPLPSSLASNDKLLLNFRRTIFQMVQNNEINLDDDIRNQYAAYVNKYPTRLLDLDGFAFIIGEIQESKREAHVAQSADDAARRAADEDRRIRDASRRAADKDRRNRDAERDENFTFMMQNNLFTNSNIDDMLTEYNTRYGDNINMETFLHLQLTYDTIMHEGGKIKHKKRSKSKSKSNKRSKSKSKSNKRSKSKSKSNKRFKSNKRSKSMKRK